MTRKTALLEELQSSGDELTAKLRALGAEAFAAGRYENGWNARQILAHVASIEWTYPRLLDLGKQAASVHQTVAQPSPAASPPASTPATIRRTTPDEAAGLPTRKAEGGIDSYNERQVAKRADASPAELIAEFEKNRAALIAAVESADDGLFDAQIRSAGGITGPLAEVLRAVAVHHVRMHVADIAGEEWTGQRL